MANGPNDIKEPKDDRTTGITNSGTNSSGTSWRSDVTNVGVEEATDTVYGQLQKHTDFSTPLMKRIAQESIDRSTGRGLGNTLMAQNAAMGVVVDKAGEFATKDAEIYSRRKDSNQQAGVNLEGTAMTNANRLATQELSNQGQAAVANTNAASNAAIAASNNAAQSERLGTELASLEQRAWDTISSNERLSQFDNGTKIQIAQIDASTQVLRDKNQAVNTAWGDYQNNLAGIDINAKPASQTEQARRLLDVFEARATYLNMDVPTSITGTPTTTSTGSALGSLSF